MSTEIWKFPIQRMEREQKIEVPKGSKILTMQLQHNEPCVWVMVDPDVKEKEALKIMTFATGNRIDKERPAFLIYIGTYQLYGGSLVFHVFEDLEKGEPTP
jgi:hypothetical protein